LKRGTAEIQKRVNRSRNASRIDYIEALAFSMTAGNAQPRGSRQGFQEVITECRSGKSKDQEASILYALALVATASLEDKTMRSAKSSRDPRDSVCRAPRSSRSGGTI